MVRLNNTVVLASFFLTSLILLANLHLKIDPNVFPYHQLLRNDNPRNTTHFEEQIDFKRNENALRRPEAYVPITTGSITPSDYSSHDQKQDEKISIQKSEVINHSEERHAIRKAPDSSPLEIMIERSNRDHINMPQYEGIPWKTFTSYPLQQSWLNANKMKADYQSILNRYGKQKCSEKVVADLSRPRLNKNDFQWCQWALSPEGANVVVGKSWGKLSKKDMLTFDALNCNTVKAGKNPSCDDSWGDEAIRKWIRTPLSGIECEKGRSSQLNCYKNDNLDVFCMMNNVQIDFSKWRTVQRPGNTDSKSFARNFISGDCSASRETEPLFPFPHLFSPRLSSSRCDYIHNGTVLLYSHDDIRNLGHTLNDIMNVWVMLWLSGIARHSEAINILNVDSFKLGHNWQDQPNGFFNIYRRNFHEILKGVDFKDKTLCIQKVVFQPIPPRFFIWESWFIDLPCSSLGPSALYQRYNFQVRHSYGLLAERVRTDRVLKVLLVVRKVYQNLWGSNRSSRNYLNLPEMEAALRKAFYRMGNSSSTLALGQEEGGGTAQLVIEVVDLNELTFDEQMKLAGETSIIVGMHGAGMTWSMHMPIGTRLCCGMVEIYPSGEFTPIRGHGCV